MLVGYLGGTAERIKAMKLFRKIYLPILWGFFLFLCAQSVFTFNELQSIQHAVWACIMLILISIEENRINHEKN